MRATQAILSESLHDFLASETRCHTETSIIFSRALGEILEPITPDTYGTVVIRGQGAVIYPFLENRLWQIPLYTTCSPLETGGWLLSKQFTQFKIILTDWNSSDFTEPVIDDPDCPLQGIFVFVKDFNKIVDVKFIDFIERLQTMDRSVLICYPVDGISYRQRESPFFHETNSLSVAFCGQNIETSRLTFRPTETDQIHTELSNFKRLLKFNPDISNRNEYTIGFIFDHVGCMPTYAYIDTIYKTFPKVTFTGLTMSAMGLNDCPGYSSAFTFWDLKNNQIVKKSRVKKVVESGIGGFQQSSRGEFPLLYRGVSIFLIHFTKH